MSREKRDRVHGIPIWRRARDGIWRADFRCFEGGGREALGTRDREEAEDRLYERKEELRRQASEDGEDWSLEDFCQEHLKRKAGEVADSTWSNHERALGYLCAYMDRELPHTPTVADVTTRRLSDYVQHRLGKVKASSVGTELSGISDMLRRAHDWKLVKRNEARPVRAPKPEHYEEDWLEIGEAAKVLKAAAAMEAHPPSRCYPHLRALLATFLLTGGRRMEVFGLERRDVDLENGTVRFRPNEWRGLKNKWSARSVPLWPQLRSILTPYLENRDDDNPLLFPSKHAGGKPLNDLRSSLDTVEEKAKVETRLTPKVFRHTYTAARIQTLDSGEPVSLFTVARELGHKSTARIEDTYGHLQKRRSRLSEVRYQEAEVVSLEKKRGA